MKYWSRLLPLVLALTLGGCGGQDRETLHQVDLLLAVNEYVKAFEILQAAIHQDPKDKTLRRAEIRLLLQAERVDLAYIRYQDLVNDLSKNDSVLFDLLHDKNETVRTSAVRALGLTGAPEAVPALLGALKDPDQNVRRAAASSLGDLKDVKAVPGLIEALHDKWWFARSEAAASLGKLRDVRAIAPLFAALKDDDQSVRRAAENALTIIAQNSDPAPFLQALHSDDAAVVHAATFSLVAARNSAATPVLLGYLSSTEPLVRQQGLRGLRYLIDPAALPQIRKAIDDPDATVQLEAVLAVVDYRDKESIPALDALAKSGRNPELARVAAEASGRLAALP